MHAVTSPARATAITSSGSRYIPPAPGGFSSLLALEIPTGWWPAEDSGHRCRTDHGCEIHGEEKATTVAGLEDLPSQSCRRHTAHPSAEWVARQLTEAYGWQQAPRYTIRDRDCAYGAVLARRLRAMGIRIGPLRRDRHGITEVRRGLSDQSGGIALIMSLCLASSTFVICSNRTKNIQRSSHALFTG